MVYSIFSLEKKSSPNWPELEFDNVLRMLVQLQHRVYRLRTKEHLIGVNHRQLIISFVCFSANEFPSSFESIVRKILRLLYHVVAHIYHCHFREVALLGLHAHLNCVFAHLTLLNQRFNLIDPKETEILGDLEAALLGKLYICRAVANDVVLIDADYAMPPRDPRPNCATEYFL